jgi:iron complex outermembrane receptor protein
MKNQTWARPRKAGRAALLVGACFCSLFPVAARAEAAPASNGPAVEEIVVTAQRREERLQDVPIAVSAFTGSQLERAGVDGTKQLTQITPGLYFTQAVFSPQPTIRGIGVRGAGAGDESVVPIYIDGVYQPFIAGAELQFNNIERVEVLKGPQGALLGRNATGGAINIITKTPTATPSGAVSVSLGRFNEKIAKGYFSAGGAILAGDVAVVATRDHGYVRDRVTGDRYAVADDVAVRSKLHFTPSERVDFTLSAAYINNHDSAGVAGQPVNGNTIAARVIPRPVIATEPFTVAVSFRPYNNLVQGAGSLVGTIKFDPFDLHTLTGVQWSSLHANGDSDGTPLDLSALPYRQISRNFIQEVYATSNRDGPFSWIAGAVYYDDFSGLRPIQSFSRSLVTGVKTETRWRPTITTSSVAAYAQGAYKITDALSVTIGGRYTRERKTFLNLIGITSFTTLTNAATFEKFTPNVIVQYRVNPQLNVYAKAGQAFKSGLFNSSALTAAANKPINPETVTQYEIGMKSDPAPWLRLNLSSYYTDYSNLQVSSRDPLTGASVLQNGGSSEIYGVEAEGIVKPAENLNLRFGLSAIHGEYKKFPAAQVFTPVLVNGVAIGGNNAIFIDAKGKNIIRVPFLTANLGGDYLVPLASGDLMFAGNIYYNGKSYWDIGNRLSEKPYTLVNAEVSWAPRDSGLRLTLWGENLLNEIYDLSLGTTATADSRAYARPRTYGVRASHSW